MIYLDILIGFSLVMLVFASGVSVVQTLLKRVLTIKGAALTAPLREEIAAALKSVGGAVDAQTERALQACDDALVGRGSALGDKLRHVAVANAREVLAHLKRVGAEQLSDGDKVRWEAAVDQVDDDWDRVAALLAASYEQRTRRWIVGLSFGAVLLFNVDVIRVLQVLSVSPATRDKLVQVASQVHDEGAPAAAAEPEYAALNDWQKGNLAALASTGLPVGWGKVSLYVVDEDSGVRRDCLVGERCAGKVARWPSFLVWFYRVLGLLIGAGLVAQGAPFWYAIVDTALGLKKKVVPEAEADASALKATVDDAEARLQGVLAQAEAWSKTLASGKAGGKPEAPPPPA